MPLMPNLYKYELMPNSSSYFFSSTCFNKTIGSGSGGFFKVRLVFLLRMDGMDRLEGLEGSNICGGI